MKYAFADKIKELREERGLSINRLAKEVGVSATTVFRWEHSQADITGENLFALAKFFGVTADYLLGLEN